MNLPLITLNYRVDNSQPQSMTGCLFVEPQSALAQL